MFDLISFQNLFEAQAKITYLKLVSILLVKKNEAFMFSNAGETQLASTDNSNMDKSTILPCTEDVISGLVPQIATEIIAR